MGCDLCGRPTPHSRLCRDCGREQNQEDRVDYDYGWAQDDDQDDGDGGIAADGGDARLGSALDLVQEASSPLFTSNDSPVQHRLSLARDGLVNCGWVDGLRDERLEEVDRHLEAAIDLAESESVLIPARNARQLLRSELGGGQR